MSKHYSVIIDVSKAEGYQGFYVKASSGKEAIEKFKKGEYEYIHEQEIEVIGLDNNSITVEELEEKPVGI